MDIPKKIKMQLHDTSALLWRVYEVLSDHVFGENSSIIHIGAFTNKNIFSQCLKKQTLQNREQKTQNREENTIFLSHNISLKYQDIIHVLKEQNEFAE